MFENSIEIHVGRLIEVRTQGFETVEDVRAMQRMAKERAGALGAGALPVVAADWRQCALLSPNAAEEVLKMFVGANAASERAALLHSERSPTTVMQFLRLIRDSKNPNRRMFSDPLEMASWLAEVLTPSESTRLRDFLGLAPGGKSLPSP
jgi:hypothetical protein